MKNESIYLIACSLLFYSLVTLSITAQKKGYVFLENPDSVISMEASNYYAAKGTSWKVIPYFGITLSGVTLLSTTKSIQTGWFDYEVSSWQ